MDHLPRFVGIWMVFVIFIAVSLEGVAYNGTCTGSGVGNCADTTNICDATSQKCACSPTSYLKHGTTKCADKIALAGTCTATPTGQCEDSIAKCHATDLICVCTSNFFAKKNAACASQVAALDGTCDATDPASDQCAVANSECRTNGTDKCLCKATHYVKGAACTIRVAYNGTCTGSGVGNCADTTNICDATSHKCACSPTSYLKHGTTKCADKIALAGTCTATPTGQCADSNAKCHATDLICVCTSNFFAKKNAACASQVAALDGTCDATDPASDQCVVANSECRTNGTDKCLCKATHYVKGAACTIRRNPDATCGGDECVTHASCVSSKCKCGAGYTPSPTTSPTMCSGVVKFAALSCMYVVPFLVSMMFLLR